MKKITWKTVKKFIMAAGMFYAAMELFEWLLNHFFHINVDTDLGNGVGWLLFVVIWGFKFHIWCCVAPVVYATFKCRHKKCHHDHCHTEQEVIVPDQEFLDHCKWELDFIFKYKEPTITFTGLGYHIRITRPASGNKQQFIDYLHNQSNIFKNMEIVTYWTDGKTVIFTTKFIRNVGIHN